MAMTIVVDDLSGPEIVQLLRQHVAEMRAARIVSRETFLGNSQQMSRQATI
ncbi:MAG: hypothetical protein ACRDHX_16565 [Chloroflexota bacterium]